MKNTIFELLLVSILLSICRTNQSSIHPDVNLCKRNDPNISDCYCQNFRTMLPRLNDGAPKMHIPSLDPMHLLNIVMNLSQLHSVHLVTNIYNITARGFSDARVAYCYINIDNTGMVQHLGFNLLTLTIDANYDILGSFANYTLNSTGDFYLEFERVFVNTTWKGSKYMKNNQEHLDFKCEFGDVQIGDIKVRFDAISENEPQIDKTFNAMIADNIDTLANEIIPIGEQVAKSILEQMVDAFFDTFPYDVLFPPN